MSRVVIPYDPNFKVNERGYLVHDESRKGQAGWIVDSHCGEGLIYVAIRCPDCCDVFSLTPHSISIDGEVNASIFCPCKIWHIWGTLDRYKEIVGYPKAANQLFIDNPAHDAWKAR